MPQQKAWEQEYHEQKLVSMSDEPSQDVKNFARYLRKKQNVPFETSNLLDLGSGVGKNAHYFASFGSTVTGFELARNALLEAQKRALERGLSVIYTLQSIGEQYPLNNDSQDIVLDIMSSNSLSERERTVYLREVSRVLKKGGHFFVRALAKDGDKNAQTLLKMNPGAEKDTYVMNELNLTERVFSKEDLIATYEPYFEIAHLEKKTNYARVEGKTYKRNYWILYLTNRE